jgi:transposase
MPAAIQRTETALPENAKRNGPHQGSVSRKCGCHALVCHSDATVTAKVSACLRCRAGLTDAHQVLHSRHDHIDLPVVHPLASRVERYAGHCPCCGNITWRRCR